jgi:hypothetical protein
MSPAHDIHFDFGPVRLVPGSENRTKVYHDSKEPRNKYR